MISPSLGATARRLCSHVATTLALGVLSACGGTETATPLQPPPATTGALSIVITGLPAAATANVRLSGPGGFARTVAASESLTGLAPGAYDLAASDVTVGASSYRGSVSPSQVTVRAGATESVQAAYSIATGSIAFDIKGVPAGGAPVVRILGPGGVDKSAPASGAIEGLAPGVYRVSVAAITAEGHTFTPSAATALQDVTVTASPTPTTVSLQFELATGALQAVVSGLPSGVPASVSVTGPNNFKKTVSPGDIVTNLAPGAYVLTGNAITIGTDAYRVMEPVAVSVGPSVTPVAATVRYILMSGKLTISIAGLPLGTPASVRVDGPGGFERTITQTTTLEGLTSGDYTITPVEIRLETSSYSAGAPQDVFVQPSAAPTPVTVTYALSSGSLQIIANGLPQSVPANILVTGPDDFSAVVTTTSILGNLKPGTYVVTARSSTAGLHIYAATPAMRTVNVAISQTPSTASVTYALASGMLQLNLTGLPTNVTGNVVVTGPAGYTRPIGTSTLLTGLTPGAYTITAGVTQSFGAFWGPNPSTQTVSIAASTSAIQATVAYTSALGNLIVNVTGLPAGTAANVQLTGPSGYSRQITASETISGLLQGSYSAAVSPVTVGATTYSATPATLSASVTSGSTATLNVAYSGGGGSPPPPPPAGLNLTIESMHVQQVVQNTAGNVPLIAGRGGLLRVFVKASSTNSAAPAVRVRFYEGTTLNSTVTITAPGSSVPTTTSQASLTSSWNYAIPAALMQPGLKVLADVDPSSTVVESSESDNTFPVSGTPASLNIRSAPPIEVRFVPVVQSVSGATGSVSTATASQFLSFANKVFPYSLVSSDVRAAYTSTSPLLQADDANGAWGQVLSEINALRTADGSNRYYVGVVKVGYNSGVAGIGYVPGRATLTWDDLPSGSDVLAHELGHNFGRMHAPCGEPGNVDPSYPYSGGNIGVFGYDFAASALKASSLSDLMGYCAQNWISDYTYKAVLEHLSTGGFVAGSAMGRAIPPRRGMLVWGRIERGRVILEPSYEVDAAPALPTRAGPHRLQFFDARGTSMLDLRFAGERVADANDPTAQHFAFVVPMDMLGGTAPASIRIDASGRSATNRATLAPTAAAEPTATRDRAGVIRVRWSAQQSPGALIRDAATGQILAFGRGGEAIVRSTGSAVDVSLSDGVRTTTRRLRADLR